MSSFGSEGAGVMTCRHAGVATLLRSKNTQMILYLSSTSSS